jgi:hypothetical protein
MTLIIGRLGMTAIPDALVIEDYLFADDGRVPNNPLAAADRLPRRA